MIPGEIIVGIGPVELNPGRAVTVTRVVNTGDRPIQVGSHYHLSAANPALDFDRQAAWGMRLAIAAGTSVRFEPGVGRDVELVPFAGRREIPGLRNELAGPLDSAASGPASGPASGHEELRRG